MKSTAQQPRSLASGSPSPSSDQSPRAAQLFAASIALIFTLVFQLSADAAPLQVVKSRAPKLAALKGPVRRLDASARLDLAIGLPLRNADQLTNLLKEIYQPASANFRHYLTPEQFTEKFGPTQADYQAVSNFAVAHGLKVTGTHPNRMMLDVNGAVADIEKAFHVNLRLYQHPTEKRTFFAPDADPSVDLDTPLLAISGLDNFVVPHPLLRPAKIPPSSGAHPMAGSGNMGSYQGNDFRAAYAPGVSLTGAGQSIGLFELDGFKATDISSYETEAGLPKASISTVLIDGFNGSASLAQGDDEVALDIDVSSAMAPGANIIVYEGPPPPSAANTDTAPITTTHVNDLLNRMATDNKASQLSCSWGFDINATTQQIFQQFAAQGQSFFLACGDSGAFVGAVPEPADDPFVTVVGGTELNTTGPDGFWSSEITWNSSSAITGPAATGGGISLTYPIPDYQQGVSMAANLGSTTMRNVPDVAMVAEGVWIVANGSGGSVGGTSVAAPLWAGFMALVNQQAASSGLPPVGFANPAIYAIGRSANYKSCFHDITQGNNTTPTSPSLFFATTGYDLCTGWGTPAGNSLIQALLAPPMEPLVISPPLGFTASGPIGGPFNVASQTYMLTNTGSASLNWSLVNTSSWLTASATSGTLSPGGTADFVTVSLNSTSTNSLIASYSGNVVISNLTDGASWNQSFGLLVGNGGFETGDFTDWTLVGDTNENFALAADDATIDGDAAITGINDWQLVHSGLYGALLGQVSSVATLSHVIPTTPGQTYLLSFWLTSVPFQGSTTPSEFSASWNGTTLVSQTDLGVFGWTNYQFVVTATSTATELQFSDRDDPAALGLDDVTVQPIIPPSIQMAVLSANAIAIAWNAVPGLIYQIQTTGTLFPPNWTNSGAPITATSTSISVSEPLNAASQQFYRVIQLPP